MLFRNIMSHLITILTDYIKGKKSRHGNSKKIFCIGRNKTGTTSLKHFFESRGYPVGNQSKAEKLFPQYKAGNFQAIIEYCHTAQVFQDCPFSYPETYKYLDQAFPGSQFILTLRDSPEQWYNSVVNFRRKCFGYLPEKKDLQRSKYAYKGYYWDTHNWLYNTPEDNLYHPEILKNHYLEYNQEIINYFTGRNNLLVINLANHEDYYRLCDFIDLQPEKEGHFPWKNKT